MKANFNQEYYDRSYFFDADKPYRRRDGSLAYWGYGPDEKNYGRWDGWKLIAKFIKSNLHPVKLLDIGGANGAFIYYCLLENIDAYSCDFSQFILTKPFHESVRDRLLYADACDLSSFRDREFNVVTAWDVLEHIYLNRLDKAVSEIKRVSSKYILLNIASAIDKEYVLNEGEEIPLELEESAVAGHVTVKKQEFWINLFKDLRLRRDLMRRFPVKNGAWRFVPIFEKK